jgi:hypothetical protein
MGIRVAWHAHDNALSGAAALVRRMLNSGKHSYSKDSTVCHMQHDAAGDSPASLQ